MPIENSAAIGKVVRASRKAQKIRQDDAPGGIGIGISEIFLVKIERGSDFVQWGKLFLVLEGLGIRGAVDVPAYLCAPSSGRNKRWTVTSCARSSARWRSAACRC